MPRQEVKLESSIILDGQDPQDAIRRIKSGEIGVSVLIEYCDALNKRTSLIETFYNEVSDMNLKNVELNPPDSKITKMLKDAINPVK